MLQATREEEEHAAGPEKRKSMLRATSIRESIIFEEVRRVVKSIIFEEVRGVVKSRHASLRCADLVRLDE